MNTTLLKELCAVHAPSGDESALRNFLLSYIAKHKKNWKVQSKIFHGGAFQDSIMLVFGKPRTAVFAHIDSIGFTAGYNNNLIKIGGPASKTGFKLRAIQAGKELTCTLKTDKKTGKLTAVSKQQLQPGTTLTFVPVFKETKDFVQCCYMDNRLGVYIALKLAETLKDGIIAFTTYEEHGGGNAQFLGKYMYEKFGVRQALIADITWVTEGVKHGKGAAVSLRDSMIPRKVFTDSIQALLKSAKIPYQAEVESAGGSDGSVLQRASLPFDWCFIGAPESNVHSPTEKVHKNDITSMLEIYTFLMKKL